MVKTLFIGAISGMIFVLMGCGMTKVSSTYSVDTTPVKAYTSPPATSAVLPFKDKTTTSSIKGEVGSLAVDQLNIVQGEEEKGGWGYFMLGKRHIDIKNLNEELVNKGYSKFSDDFTFLGGGGRHLINRLIIGAEGYFLLRDKNTTASYKTSIDGGYGFFDVGYLLFKKEDLMIYPLLGIGGGGFDIEIKEKVPSATGFGDILTNPRRESHLSVGGPLLNLAIGIDWFLTLTKKEEKNKGGLVFGLQASYLLPLTKWDDWYLCEKDISGGPNIAFRGFYLSFAIGGFGEK